MASRKLDRSLIRGFDLFRDMTEDNLDAVLATVQVRTVEPGEPVFSQGAAADEFFLLLHGHLKVVQVTPSVLFSATLLNRLSMFFTAVFQAASRYSCLVAHSSYNLCSISLLISA